MRSRPTAARIAFAAALFAALWVAHPAAAGEPYGEPLTVAETTPIADLLADPQGWAGRTVRVEGEVAGVCRAKGCWIELTDIDRRHLRVKVEDDVIVFPQDAPGRHAVAEGEVEVIELTREQWIGWRRHLAEEQGEELDESTVDDGPHRIVQIAATGAEIAAPETTPGG